MSRVRVLLAAAALLLGLGAAIVKTPAPRGRAAARPALYKPPSGC